MLLASQVWKAMLHPWDKIDNDGLIFSDSKKFQLQTLTPSHLAHRKAHRDSISLFLQDFMEV